MADKNTIKCILDHLAGTAVYVIRQADRRILYFNEMAKRVIPQVRMNEACRELWEECGSLILRIIGPESKGYHWTIGYSSIFGTVVDMSAIGMDWEDDQPAWLISLAPHSFSPIEKRMEMETRHLAAAAAKVYPLIISINLTQNEFHMLANNGFYIGPMSRAQSYDQLLEGAAETIHPNFRQGFLETLRRKNIEKAFSEGKRELYLEHLQIDEEKNYHWTATHILHMESEGGDTLAMALSSNIDERKQIEKEREVFNTGVTAMFGECLVVAINKGTFTTLKFDHSWPDMPRVGDFHAMIHEYCRNLIHPEDQKEFVEAFSMESIRRNVSAGEKFISREFRRLSPEGFYRWSEMIGLVVSPEESNDPAMILAFRDIHELRVAQAERRDANLRFTTAVNNLYNLIYEGDLIKGTVYIWNMSGGSLKRVYGDKTLDEHFEDVLENHIRPDYREDYKAICNREELKRQFINGAKEVYREAPRKMADGAYRWYSTQAQVLFRDDQHFRVMFYLKDMDDAKKADDRKRAALLDALSLAEQANSAKTDFLSRMSHDIRTPMNAVIGMSAIAKAHIGNVEKTEECLNKIDVAAQFLLSLINDILDMTKIESGKMTINLEPFHLEEFLANIETVISSQIQQKNQVFVMEAGEGLDEYYIGDTLRLNQILMNLMSNAVKYTPEGGRIVLRANVERKGKRTSFIHFEVEDTGIGMTKEFLKRMYDPFVQEADGNGRVIEGTGLGLSITRNLVRMMNGTISVVSVLGQGSRFTVEIPLKLVLEDEAGQRGKKDLVAPPPAIIADEGLKPDGKRILLVEDNEINMDIAKTILEMEGFEIETATNGKEALDKFSRSPLFHYSMILMDIRMPVMDGYESSQRIRKLDRTDAAGIPILAMTANAFSDDICYARNAGMNSHLAKPLNLSAMMEEIKKYL